MIEYLHNAIRAVAGLPIGIAATISNDDTGEPITSNCSIVLYDTDTSTTLFEAVGNYIKDADLWQFEIPSSVTAGLAGRYWYCIENNNSSLCFKEPIYLK